MFRDDDKKSNDVETIIGQSVNVEGNFVGDGNVVIDGKVTGTVKTKGMLRVGANAVIRADVDAAQIMLAGVIRGSVNARERLELAPSARIFGNVSTRTIIVNEGAIINGKCSMKTDEAVPEEPAAQKKFNKDPKGL